MMIQRSSLQQAVFAVIFTLALVSVIYFARQVSQGGSPSPVNFLAADKSYGVTIDLTQLDDPTLASSLAALQENGLLWLRQPVRWAEIEPAPGQFNWQPLDRVFDTLSHSIQTSNSGNRFKIISVLHTTPAWARPPGSSQTTPPSQVSNLGRFARAFAARYGHQLNYYQIWHEPNLCENWGDTFVNPAAYANLLRDAALNIRDVDPDALILTAALAPTRENGPLNLNEMAYLDGLYRARANRWFDIVAGQPYGFDFDAEDSPNADILNFNRLELLRRVMLDHDDAETPIWATAFGWNALPLDWAGQPSPWRDNQNRVDPPAVQAQRTAAALILARQNWPWLGPVLAVRWNSATLLPDDPARGFALSETPLVLDVFRQVSTAAAVATVGRYPATHPGGQFSPGWRTALFNADIPRAEPRTLTISFEGTRLDLTVDRGPYRGYLWVTVDGQAANALPKDNNGRSYVTLYDPLRESDTVILAQNLAPGPHVAEIKAQGGWGQWAVTGWTVSNAVDTRRAQAGLLLAGALVGIGVTGLIRQFSPAWVRVFRNSLNWAGWRKLGRLGEWQQLAVTVMLAAGVCFVPGWPAQFLLVLLAVSILARPDVGLALIAFSLSFFQSAKQPFFGPLFFLELILILSGAGVGIRVVSRMVTDCRGSLWRCFNLKLKTKHQKSMDWAALTLLTLGLAATVAAANFGVSMFEWRILLLGSVAYYFLVRVGSHFGPVEKAAYPLRWVWRLIDAFVAGAVVHSLLVLGGYLFADQFVSANSVHRVVSPFYASPNNLALFLDRVWPIVAAVTLLPGTAPTKNTRRWFYGAGLVLLTVVLYLTYSKGALLLGLPVGAAAMIIFYGIRHRKQVTRVGGGVAVIALAAIALSRIGRFRTVFDLQQGDSSFFRLKVWQAALNLLRDHWPLGVGLNNFLYQYRTRYILPEAWQESNLSHPHNIFLDFGTRLGIGGVAALLWLQSAFWITAWRLYLALPEPLVLGLMGSMIVFLSHGLIDNAFFLIDLAFAFFLIAGIVQRLSENYTTSN